MIAVSKRTARTNWVLNILLVACAGLVVSSHMVLEQLRTPELKKTELMYLPKGEYLKIFALGYRNVAADLIWIKALQFLGERNQSKEGYSWAYHAVDVLTDLDPDFQIAYQATGTILGVWAGMPHESIKILTKGMKYKPEWWLLPFFVGYNYYYELQDLDNAAKYFRIASDLPGAPPYLAQLAARMTVEAGDPNAALEFLIRMYQQVQDDRLKENLERRMKEVMVERDIRLLEKAVVDFRMATGRSPATFQDLVVHGIIRQIPQEPFGGSYRLSPNDGSVTSTMVEKRLRVHRRS